MRSNYLPLIVFVSMAFACLPLYAEGVGDARVAERLFPNGETSANFALREIQFPDRPSPEKELLDKSDNQQAIAQLLKEERNKKAKPGFTPPDDKNSKGIKIRFDGIRFVRDAADPTRVIVRLVGPVNEFEYKAPISIETLVNSKDPIPVRFQSVTNQTGVKVTITTDMKLQWQDGDLLVTETKGNFDFAVATLSPARLFYNSDSDSIDLPDYRGKRVAENDLPPRTVLDPENL